MLSQQVVNLVYLVAAVLFILDLKWMAHPRTAVRGNRAGAMGMALAVAATLLSGRHDWSLILIGVAVGAVIGAVAAIRVKMTAMPELVGLFNGFGGAASVLVAGSAVIAAVASATADTGLQMRIATVASAFIGSVTFFGSYVAFGKLAEFLAVKWKLYPWQRVVKYGFSLVVAAAGLGYAAAVPGAWPAWLVALCGLAISGILLVKKDRFPGMDAVKMVAALAALAVAVLVVLDPGDEPLFWLLVAVAGIVGVILTLSIGGADMPVVIALLNSSSGLAAAATGFVIDNTVLIIAGSLVGASGIILTNIMCKAMNRSLVNVLF
ncbi:MAG TPA: NAD(P)(+) transhydrogenase (Re/Si-specific) subunit beta, partial [Candidatus Sulfomarinibacteraceae bacterium]|nr:NAD(P)(+) transhydrogenase (Re/Si-specific) subunit beta [Candidatus Sulfomarinibacteraceae bacterium]